MIPQRTAVPARPGLELAPAPPKLLAEFLPPEDDAAGGQAAAAADPQQALECKYISVSDRKALKPLLSLWGRDADALLSAAEEAADADASLTPKSPKLGGGGDSAMPSFKAPANPKFDMPKLDLPKNGGDDSTVVSQRPRHGCRKRRTLSSARP